MKKMFALLMALATIFAAFPSYALTQNLPHHNSSDVDDWVKIFIPYRVESVGVKTPTGTVSQPTFTGSALATHQHDAITAGVPEGTNSAPALTMNAYTPAGTNSLQSITLTAGTSGQQVYYDAGKFYAVGAGTVDLPLSTFVGTTSTLTGSVAAPTFTGTTMSTHQHAAITAGTPAGTVSQPTFTGTATTLQGLGVGDPTTAEVNSLGFGATQMEAAGDDIHMIVPLPDNICINCQIKMSVAWSTNDVTPTTDTATWKILYAPIAAGEALSAASTALDTVITADAISGVSYGLQETPQGIINAGTLSRGDTLHILAELDAVSGLNPGSDVVFFHGIYIEYVREKL